MSTFKLPSIVSAVEFRREAFGWTAMKMAKALGLTRGHYSEFVNGKRALPMRARCKAFELGVPADVLLQTAKTKREYEKRQDLLTYSEAVRRAIRHGKMIERIRNLPA